jgi:pilus assembly protein Flp/PilA
MQRILNFIRDNSGATAVEYAIMASLIAVAIAGSVYLLGQNVENLFSTFVSRYPR